MCFAVAAALACLYMLKQEDSLHRQSSLLANEEGVQYARATVVRLWDCQVYQGDAVEEQKLVAADTFRLLDSEVSIAQQIRNRTPQERLSLLIRRLVVNAVVLVLVLVSWAVLIAVSVASPYLGQLTYFADSSSLNALMQLAMQNLLVPAALQVLSAGAPIIVGVLTRLERWDSPAFALKMLITRIFFIKVLNVIVVMVSYMQLLLVGTANYDWFAPTIDVFGLSISLSSNDTNSQAEDTVGEGLMIIILVDFVADKLSEIASYLFSRLVARLRYVP